MHICSPNLCFGYVSGVCICVPLLLILYVVLLIICIDASPWCAQVVEDVPYLTSLDIMDKYNCDICVHGGEL